MPFRKPFDEVLDVFLEVGDGYPLLIEIDSLGAAREPSHQGEVAAVATHHLDHEATPRRYRRLLDLVDRFDDRVERSIGADRELRPREVVVDRRRHADERDIEGGKRLTFTGQTERGVIAGPAANHEDAVDREILDIACDRVEVLAAWNRAVDSELATAGCGPAAHAHPTELLDITVNQPLKSAPNTEHLVPLVESEPHCGAGGGVHARRGSARRDDGEAEPALTRAWRIRK